MDGTVPARNLNWLSSSASGIPTPLSPNTGTVESTAKFAKIATLIFTSPWRASRTPQFKRWWFVQRTVGGSDGAGGHAGNLIEEAAPIEAVGAQPLGDSELHLPVRHRCQKRGV